MTQHLSHHKVPAIGRTTVPIVAVCAVIGVTLWGIAWIQIFNFRSKGTYNWSENSLTLVDSCNVGLIEFDRSKTLQEQSQKEPPSWIEMLIPFRRNPSYFHFSPSTFARVICYFDLHGLGVKGRTWLMLGPIFGDAIVKIDDIPWAAQQDDNEVTFLVPEPIKTGRHKLEFIARDPIGAHGPGSTIPLVAIDSFIKMETSQRQLWFMKIDAAMFYRGLFGAIVAMLGLCWIAGLRYRDMQWTIIAGMWGCISSYRSYIPLGGVTDLSNVWGDIVLFSMFLAVIFSCHAILRLGNVIELKVQHYLATVFIFSCFLMLPDGVRNLMKFPSNYAEPFYIICFGVLAYFALREKLTLPRRRKMQRGIMIGLLILFAVILAVCFFIKRTTGINFTREIAYLLTTVFATFVAVDLAVFHRSFLHEKSLKEEGERQRFALEERLELGQSIQRLLMPPQQKVEFGPFRVYVHFESAEKMAGDWFTWWENDDKFQVLCGDVVGKGPQAAIASTSILTTCRNLSKDQHSIPDTIQALNTSLRSLFQASMVSTVAGAELQMSGDVTLYNLGFVGWVHMRNGQTNFIPQRGPSLGTAEHPNVTHTTVNLQPGERLMVFSDGVIEGARALKELVKLLGTIHATSSAEDIAAAVVKLGTKYVHPDDRTIVIIERV